MWFYRTHTNKHLQNIAGNNNGMLILFKNITFFRVLILTCRSQLTGFHSNCKLSALCRAVLWPSVQKDLHAFCSCVLPGWGLHAAGVPADCGAFISHPFLSGIHSPLSESSECPKSLLPWFPPPERRGNFYWHFSLSVLPVGLPMLSEQSYKKWYPNQPHKKMWAFHQAIHSLQVLILFQNLPALAYWFFFFFFVFCPEFIWTNSKSTVIPACSGQKFPGGEIFYVLLLYKFL